MLDERTLKNMKQQLDGMTAETLLRRLSAYVEPPILREMLREDARERNTVETEEVVLLFADIRGFTRFSQEITPTQLVAVLELFLETMGACIHKYNGIIDKYMGDCVMAYWRVQEQKDALYTACRTALELQERARDFSAFVQAETGHELGVGVGIHSGPALLCHVGNQQYRAYTVIGSTVNIACRLEEYARAGEIYISRVSAEKLEGRIVIEPMEVMQRRRNRDVMVPMEKLIGLAGEG